MYYYDVLFCLIFRGLLYNVNCIPSDLYIQNPEHFTVALAWLAILIRILGTSRLFSQIDHLVCLSGRVSLQFLLLNKSQGIGSTPGTNTSGTSIAGPLVPLSLPIKAIQYRPSPRLSRDPFIAQNDPLAPF